MAHNKINLLTSFDIEALQTELKEILKNDNDIDLDFYSFDLSFIELENTEIVKRTKQANKRELRCPNCGKIHQEYSWSIYQNTQ